MGHIKRRKMGLILVIMLSISILALTSGTSLATAIPNLQLDILGGTYDSATQTIIAPGNSFTLYAYLLKADQGNYPLNDTYYISAALVPPSGNPVPNPGTFTFNSYYFNTAYNGTHLYNTVDLLKDDYADNGVPPHYDAIQGFDTGDLEQHNIFDTYFKEFKFILRESRQISPYDTVDRATKGTPIQLTGSGMYYAKFQVNTSNLAPGYAIHFDIYTLKPTVPDGNYTVNHYAPFGYDAQSLNSPAPVPEPSTIMLLGSGLVGLGFWGRRKFKARN